VLGKHAQVVSTCKRSAQIFSVEQAIVKRTAPILIKENVIKRTIFGVVIADNINRMAVPITGGRAHASTIPFANYFNKQH
jgi:hypothetical protein